jgi:hypothetical protein
MKYIYRRERNPAAGDTVYFHAGAVLCISDEIHLI